MPAVDVEDIETLGNRSSDVERMLANDYHVSWTYEPEFDIALIDVQRSLENQARIEPISLERLESYTELWIAGALFPPIICYWVGRGKNKKLVACDGNHRIGSAIQAGRTTIDVYVLDAKTRPETIDLITQTANAFHGKNMTLEEQIRAAMHFMDNRTSAKKAALRTGLTENQVRTARNKHEVEKRADDAGVNPTEWDDIPVTSKVPLKSLPDNETFRSVAKLVYQAQPNVAEISAFVADINDEKEPSKRQVLIRAKKGEWQDRVQRNGGGLYGTASNRAPAGPKQHIRKILDLTAKLPDNTVSVAKQYGKAECAAVAADISEAAAYLADVAKELARKA